MTATTPERTVEALYDQAAHHDGVTCVDDDRPATAVVIHGMCLSPICARHAAGISRWLAMRELQGELVGCAACDTHGMEPSELNVVAI